MRKIELIRAIMQLQALKVITPAMAFNYVKQIMDIVITGTNKNFDINKGEPEEEKKDG